MTDMLSTLASSFGDKALMLVDKDGTPAGNILGTEMVAAIEYQKEKRPSRLPKEYKELAWINNDLTCYLNTGYVPVGDEVFDMDVVLTEASNNSSRFTQIMGCRVGAVGTSSTNCWLGINNSRTLLSRFGTVNPTGTITLTIGTEYHVTVDLANKVTTVNDSQYTYANSDIHGISIPVHLFHVNQGSGSSLAVAGKLSMLSYVIRRGGEKIMELVPSMRLGDSEVGMYNLVSNTFLTNIGTGSFVYGEL